MMLQSKSVTNCKKNLWPVSNKKLLRGVKNGVNKYLSAATTQASLPVATIVRVIPCKKRMVFDTRRDKYNWSSLSKTKPWVICRFQKSGLSSPHAKVNSLICKKPAYIEQKAAYRLTFFWMFLYNRLNIACNIG